MTLPSATSANSRAAGWHERGLARLATGLVAVTWGLLVVGASVRAHGAGLACPDWPLCFGQVVPVIDFGVAFEFGHRVLAGSVSLGFAVLLAGMLVRRKFLPRWLIGVGLAALGTLALQIVLGGLTVLELLAQWTVTSHLLAGNTFCLLLAVLALGLHEVVRPVVRTPVRASARGVAAVLGAMVPLQLALGGLVSSNHAGLVCGALWPQCTAGAWFPTFEGLIGLHLLHRLTAYALVAAAIGAVAATGGSGRAGRTAWLVFAAIGLQAAIGIANVLLALPVEVTLLHTAGAAGVVLSTTLLHWELWRAPLARRAAAPSFSGTPAEAR
jgi:cytochrome c oxidase assembly protein subunit 15